MASPACLLGTKPTWSFLIRQGKKEFKRLARIFVKIFMSMFRREIGLKLAQEEWFRSGLGIIAILAVRRVEVKVWPFFTELNMFVRWGATTSAIFL